MLESLRARLLVWHTAIVAMVIAGFGGTVCYLVWRGGLADIDETLRGRATVMAAALRPAERETFDLTVAPDADTELYHAIWNAAGGLIDQSDDTLSIPHPAGTGTATRQGRRELVIDTPSGARILVGRDLAPLRHDLWKLAAVLFGAGVAVLALSLAGGWLFAGRALAPIHRINHTARQMIDGDLSARIPIERVETELGQVARALNGAFDRLQASLDRQRRLTADVSHELRTPISTISTEVQWSLNRERAREAYRESLAVCQRAAGRMQSIVERLLTMARAEAQDTRDRAEAVRIDDLVRQAATELAPLAQHRDVAISIDASPSVVTGDPDRLLEAVTNVLANAIAYNVPSGRVAITSRVVDHRVQLSIADTGVGIASQDLPLIFDPFFRADQARTRDAGGAGLGLALTRSIIERHRGSISCTSLPGTGTTMTIDLPASSST